MTRAYILTALSPGAIDQAISELRKIKDIEKISVTAGEYDIMLRVIADTNEDLVGLASEIQRVSGVKKTVTHVVGKEITT